MVEIVSACIAGSTLFFNSKKSERRTFGHTLLVIVRRIRLDLSILSPVNNKYPFWESAAQEATVELCAVGQQAREMSRSCN